MRRNVCHVYWLGRIEYSKAWTLQRRLAEARAEGKIPDTLLLLEHPPTYTIGKRGNDANLLVSRDVLSEEGIELFHVDRGGDITFHGPGQLVGYPILSLKDRSGGPSRYLRDLEEVVIKCLAGFNISADRIPGLTGVWVGGEKIAAIGVKITAGRVTIHGFALNVATDLSHFARIIPCGIQDKGVTSLDRLLHKPMSLEPKNNPPSFPWKEPFVSPSSLWGEGRGEGFSDRLFREASSKISSALGEIFGFDMIESTPEDLSGYIDAK